MLRLEDVIEYDFVSLIFNYIGMLESVKSFSLVNRSFYKKVLREFIPRCTDVVHGKPKEPSGKRLCDILDVARLRALDIGAVSISPAAEKVVRETLQPMIGLRQAGYNTDLMKLNAALYSVWGSIVASPTTGVFHVLKDGFSRCKDKMGEWFHNLMNDCLYWQSSRVYDDFIVLLERRDGTILVSKDYKKVYLVLGIAQSVGEVFYTQTLSHKKTVYRPPNFHGPILGLEVSTTLLNWEGRITYDGCTVNERMSRKSIHKAIQAYIHAVDTGTLIIVLEKKPISFPVDSDVKKAFIERSDEEEQVTFTDEHFAAIKSVNSSMEECLNVINSLDYIPSTEG